MTNSYAKACTELLEIIKYLPQEEYERIPKEKIDFWEQSKDKDYNYRYDVTKPINEQNISQKTNAMIILMFRDYFASEQQKEKLEHILIENDKKLEEQKREKYKYEDIFKNNNIEKVQQNEDVEAKSLTIINNKKSWIQKIFDKIKSIFKK